MLLAATIRMEPQLDVRSTPLPSIFDHPPAETLVPEHTVRQRRFGLWAGFAAIAAGTGIAALVGSPRRALLGGGAAALALGVLRVQVGRWFTETPTYDVVRRAGVLEIRDYPARIEATTTVETDHLEPAIDLGYGRLACFVYGANAGDEDIARTTPVITTMRDGTYRVAFVMPADRAIARLPAPDDLRIELREVPAHRVAVLAFHGRFTTENVQAHERELLERLVDAGLAARGSVAFACYDSPATLPMLRRNELWIEVV